MRRVLPLVFLAMLFTLSGWAAPIFVNNNSFETPGGNLGAICGPGCTYTFNGPQGWIETGISGTFRPGPPGSTAILNYMPDGTAAAFANTGMLRQVVGIVNPSTYYILRVMLGNRKDTPFTSSAQLVIGGVAIDAVGSVPGEGNWSQYVATFNSTLNPADVGDPVEIRLLTTGVQGNFDNVRLDAITLPEPASMTFIGGGLIALGLLARRRRK
jgi:hypothetical protein